MRKSYSALFIEKNKVLISSCVVLIFFYFMGIVTVTDPQTRAMATQATFLGMITNALLLMLFVREKITKRSLIVFALIALGGFAIEVVGVQTGAIFGQYRYGESLGLKIAETPLIIGLNWLLLTYMSASLFESANWNTGLKVGAAALTMVVFDIALEACAPLLDMWHWQQGKVPAQNYVAWFVIAYIFQTILHKADVKINNPIAPLLFIFQFLFFLIIAMLIH